MKMEFRAVGAALAVAAFGLSAWAWAAPPSRLAALPRTVEQTKGPLSHYLYKNDDGVFELELGGHGSAKYRWKDGLAFQSYIDNMRFVREATFYTDDESHKGWIYEASGGGNTWWLFFGATTMGKDENDEDLYPLYFSQEDPTKNKFDRWRTRSGTTRLKLP